MIYHNNPVFKGASGKFGGTMVFRQVNGRTVASKMPRKPDKSKETGPQRATRSHFRETARIVKDHLQYPEVKAYYQQVAKKRNLPSAYSAAMRDYLRSLPENLHSSTLDFRP